MKTAYNDKFARINLTTGEIKTEPVDIEMAIKFIGGRGLATKILYDEGVAKVDALSPENKIIFIPGAITGTKSPNAGRYMVVTKSPLTGMIASSNSGGVWGAKLKYAGWEGLIVEGKSDKPVYIHVHDDEIQILDAQEYMGMQSEEIDDKLQEVHPDCSVLNIGTSGENQSLIAAVMNDKHRAAGRSGVGAVMGSKNLKAITVCATKKVIEPFDEEALMIASKAGFTKIREDEVTSVGLPTYGTAVLVNIINNVGSLPTKNWQEAYFDEADETSGETLKEQYLVKKYACHRCGISCGRMIELDGKVVGGPEYETIWAYGADCGVKDLNAINIANRYCNEYGLDSISAPCTIAAAMELYQKGLITEEECEGVPLAWGSTEAIVEWTKRMGKGETELGKLMALGSYRLCEHYGHPELSMSVKKQELPAYDARGIQGIGLNYATSNRGGCHVRGYMISPEILAHPEQLDRTETKGKAGWTKIFQDLTAVIDSLGLCLFTSIAMGAEDYAPIFNAAVGTDFSAEELLLAGERIYNIERMFNQEAGMKAEDDMLPKRIMDEPIPNGPSKGMLSHLDVMLPEYYELRGWVDAFPTQETKERLGLV